MGCGDSINAQVTTYCWRRGGECAESGWGSMTVMGVIKFNLINKLI